MAKLQRDLNPLSVEQAKERTMQSVMDRINTPPRSFSLGRSVRPILVSALVLVLALIVIFFPEGETPIDDPIVLSAQESETLAELSYLTSSFIGANITVDNPFMQFLAETDETEFEKEDQKINLYFDTLRVYLEDITFNDIVTSEQLIDSEFDYLISFDLQDKHYDFYVSLDGENITGELIIGGITFDVEGTLVETDTETTFELEAISGDDYVHISYQYESEHEIESTYQVQSRISGNTSEQEISVSFENNEAKVQVNDGSNEYTLKREIEDMVTTYKLEYRINGIEGEARIEETLGADGNTVYQYKVKEGAIEKDIEQGRPDYDFDDDSPGNGNKNNENDDTEEEDDDFPGNGNPNNQSHDDINTTIKKSV